MASLGCQEAQEPTALQEIKPQEIAPQTSDRWLADSELTALLDCARENQATLVQAHRGGPRRGVAENSLGGIEASLADGAVFLELDVAKTSDGKLVLMHDETVDRTTTGTGLVSAMTYRQLADLELTDHRGRRTGEFVPTLAAALSALDGRGIAQLDLKDSVTFDDLKQVLVAAEAIDRSVIITYSLEDAIEAHEQLPEVVLSVGLKRIEDLHTLESAGVKRQYLTAWLGLGDGKPRLDAALAATGIETSYGDFRAERKGTVDYQDMAANGAEILSVDDVNAATAALATNLRTLRARCL